MLNSLQNKPIMSKQKLKIVEYIPDNRSGLLNKNIHFL